MLMRSGILGKKQGTCAWWSPKTQMLANIPSPRGAEGRREESKATASFGSNKQQEGEMLRREGGLGNASGGNSEME